MLEMPGVEENIKKMTEAEELLVSTGPFEPPEYPSDDQTEISGQDILKHYETIEPNVAEDDRWVLKALADYVKSPLIIDHFRSETERNTWQRDNAYQHPEVNDLFESNRLKGNSIVGVLQIEQLAESEGWLNAEDEIAEREKTSILEKYAELYEQYAGQDGPPSGYDKMTIEEKIVFTQNIANLAKELYRTIARQLTRRRPSGKEK